MVSWCFGSYWLSCTFQFNDSELRVFSKSHKWLWALLKCEKLQTRFLQCCMSIALPPCLHPPTSQKFCEKQDIGVRVEWLVIPLRFEVRWGFDHETSQIWMVKRKKENMQCSFKNLQRFLDIYSLEQYGNLAKPSKCFPELLLHGSILKAVMWALAYSQNCYYFQ